MGYFLTVALDAEMAVYFAMTMARASSLKKIG